MLARLIFGLKALMWLTLFAVGVIAIRYVGAVLFFFPGAIAKKLSYMLTGSSKGVVTSILFYLVAASLVLALAAVGWSIVRLDKWLEGQRNKPQE